MSRNWNEREHPRNPGGNSKGGRFRDKTGAPIPGWVKGLSDQIETKLRPLGQDPPTYSKRGEHRGQPVWPGQIVGPDRTHEASLENLGRDRGDGTREVTGAELAAYADQLPDRISYRPQGESGHVFPWEPVDKVHPSGGQDGKHPSITLYSGNAGYMVPADKKVIIKLTGVPTDEDRFFEMRFAVGGESDEPAYSVWENPERYVDRFEIQNPDTGEWGALRAVYDAENDDDEEGYHLLEFNGDSFQFYMSTPSDGDGYDYGTVKMRPIQ